MGASSEYRGLLRREIKKGNISERILTNNDDDWATTQTKKDLIRVLLKNYKAKNVGVAERIASEILKIDEKYR